ncbi:MAG: PQQ-binding-like beta-propeller repeat protein [Planctomycetales bacterium]|nr:PQQ-binding-like beta-propeller repeat protein [Planctomycetales bacterium]
MPAISPLRCALTGAVLMSLVASAAAVDPDDWPQWRGPQREGIGASVGLLQSWPEGGPKVKWKVDTVGVGYSSLAIADGRVFTQGDLNGVEHVIALSAEDGRVIWQVQPGQLGEQLDAAVAEKIKQFDKDGNGSLNVVEAVAAYGWNFAKYDLGGAPEQKDQLAHSRADTIVKAFDKDDDGKLDADEAQQVRGLEMLRVDRDDKEADVAAIASARTDKALQLDKNQDGKLDRQEVRNSWLQREFNRIDSRDPANDNKMDELLTDEELREYFTRIQGGRDGLITTNELQEHFAKQYPDGDGELTANEIRAIDGGYRNGMGDGPRGTPTVDGARLYVEGGNGHVSCLNVADGATIWQVSLRDDFGGGRPGWGYSESPLIVDDLVIVTPGGNGGTLAALDKNTGEVIWRTAGVTQAAHYSSPVVATIHGVKQIVQFARESVFGVDIKDGSPLWSYGGAANGTANCATPIVRGNFVFSSSSYGTGGGLCEVRREGDQWSATEIYFDKRMANHHGGIVRIDDYIYGFGSGGLICMNLATGEQAWANRSVGKGSLVASDGLLFLLSENHELALAEASPGEYRELGRVKLENHGRPSWAHPAIAKGVLYVRDQESLTAYEVK